MKPAYKRIMIKISGEALAGEGRFGIDHAVVNDVAHQIKDVYDMGVEIAIVVGGGNFWRGRSDASMNRATADYVGMLATVMNALVLQEAIEALGVSARVQTAIEMREIAEPYIRRKAVSELAEGSIVIFGAGTGNPFFSTDTTAALRSAEIDADVILLAKKIDAVYSDDPAINPNATKYSVLTHQEVLEKNLKVMDGTAATLCRDNDIPIHVFALSETGNIMKAVCGEKIETIVR